MSKIDVIQRRIYVIGKKWKEWVGMGENYKDVEAEDSMNGFQIVYAGSGKMMLQCFMENEGWQPYTKAGDTCGNIDSNNRLLAFRIQLLDSPGYHVFYRIYTGSGWSDWKRDNEIVGDLDSPQSIIDFDVRFAMDEPHLQYRAYMQNNGWSNFVGDNQVVGFEGQGLRMEALFIHYGGPGKLTLYARVENKGWMDNVKNDEVCGTVGNGLRLEAIRIKLSELNGYHIYYSACVKTIGWQSWVKDGEVAGTEDSGLPIEALRIRIAM